MNQTIQVIHKNGNKVPLHLKILTLSDLDQLLQLQQLIISDLPDQSWYASTERSEFEEYIQSTGKIIGLFTSDNQLVAMGIYVKNGTGSHNYGYDLDLVGDALLSVGQIESTVVHPNYRGNRLQHFLCTELEKISYENSTPILCATACPDNIFSVNTFLKLGYYIDREKLKYGGLRRYILVKYL